MGTKIQLPPPRKPKRVLTLAEVPLAIDGVRVWAGEMFRPLFLLPDDRGQADKRYWLLLLLESIAVSIVNSLRDRPRSLGWGSPDALVVDDVVTAVEILRDAEHAIREAKLAEPQNLKLARASLFYAAEKLLEEIALVVDSGR